MTTRRRNYRRRIVALVGVLVLAATITYIKNSNYSERVGAASLENFDAGYIISDYVMGKYDSMTEEEIQAFLTSKNSCSNTNREYYDYLTANSSYQWHWKDDHFVCLSEELFGDGEVIGEGETAAHIIWQAAQDFQINPKVLIVLLEKETSLITDRIPNNGDYRKATGFGCPDNAACSEKYYGFKNQVRSAASLFHNVLSGGWTNFPLGINYIQYNPSPDCGGSEVDIRSLATSALYRYTPYQPNQGAIDAGYGTTTCGAYGNRNFYLYFQDWFGGITDEDELAGCDIFCDMPEDEKSSEAIRWMYDNNITKYYSKPGEFAPSATITDEQLKILIGRFKQQFVENGEDTDKLVTKIMKEINKKPDEQLTRSDVIYALYLLNGSPITSEKDLTDLPTDTIGRAAIDWAYKNGVTKYYSKPGEVAPEAKITRREVVIFLWRLAGEPEVDIKDADEIFSDINLKDELGTKAILWAYQNGITKYYSKPGEFAPDAKISRREVAIFLWRLAGEPELEDNTKVFNDLRKNDELGTKAINWAYQNNITKYYSKPGEFAPEAQITRREVLIFLWRNNDAPLPYTSDLEDLPEDEALTIAINWAYQNGITKYYSKPGEFAPGAKVTRRELALFMYRLYLSLNPVQETQEETAANPQQDNQ